MAKLRIKIELMFERMTGRIYRNSFKTLLLVLVFFGLMAQNLPKIKVDTELDNFLHATDPVRITYNEFRDQFGRDELIIVAINPKNVFNAGFLRKLRDFHNELEENLPHLDEVTSLVNARNTRGEEDELIVEDLLENFPETEAELETLKERVLSNPFYKNLMISEDGTFTTLIIRTVAYSPTGAEGGLEGFDEPTDEMEDSKPADAIFLTSAENKEVVDKVREIASKYEGPDFPITLAGSPVMTNDLKGSMMRDMRTFMASAILIIGLVLLALFRRASGVFIPLVIVIMSLLSTVGVMAATGTAIMMPTMILPSFLLAVGVGASVHALALFFKEFDREGDKEKAIVAAFAHSGLPIVMTSLTTAVGLASFSTAEVAPIADLGIFASFGVLLSLLLTIFLIPALISILPIRRKESAKQMERHAFMDSILTRIADFATGNSKSILVFSFTIIVLASISASKLQFSHNPLVWFPDDSQIKEATKRIDTNLRGSSALEIVIDTGKENGLYEPEVLNRIEEIKSSLEKIDRGELFVGKVITFTDILKEINQALNENREEFYSIPQSRELIAQELLLFENSGSDDLETFVDSQFSMMRFTVKLPWIDAIAYGLFTYEVEETFNNTFKGLAEIKVTGLVTLLGRTLAAAIFSMGKSYLLAFGVISVMMILLVGNIRIGLISMIPNLFPIIVALGIMIPLDMPLDMFTMLIGSIAIGLAVDDTVHFMHNFRKYYHETGDVPESVRHTLLTAGRAMFVTTIVLSSGFFIFLLAEMNNLINFGILTGLAIIMALFADFLLAPALMKVIDKPGAGYEEENGVTA
jgi:hypothetical protein